MLPPDYTRVESSGVSSPDDTVEMCNDLSMKYVRFQVERIEEHNKPQEKVLSVTAVLMKSSETSLPGHRQESPS